MAATLERLLQPKTWLFLAALALVLIYRVPLGTTLLPFFMAFLLAMLMDPAVSWVQRRTGIRRTVVVLAVLLLVIVLTLGLLSIIFVRVVGDLINLAGLLPDYRKELIQLTGDAITEVNRLVEALPPEVGAYVTTGVEDFSRQALGFVQNLVQRLLAGLTGLPNLLVVAVMAVMASYFLSRDKEKLGESLTRLFPPERQEVVQRVQERVFQDLMGFLQGQFLIALMTTSLSMLVLFLMGVPYWTLLGLILGILDFIPVVGPSVVLFPWALGAILFDRPGQALWLLLLYFGIFFTRQLATPRLLGTSIGIHPVVTLISIYGGIIFFGPVGILLGPVLAIAGKAAWLTRLTAREEIAGMEAQGAFSPPDAPGSAAGPANAPAGEAEEARRQAVEEAETSHRSPAFRPPNP
ncbi:sporulation integral membrane protein YtvI [Limnochorda pilosa]|uniref:Sporulation integral membrane protein YtvI n=1 Tax=Limnochorda pilosa TaxID=1555112 RepID=A0A0K2SQ50_LIMPI|nr:sporulation integral membrane protein YtvI [Limnochorda pilosa]BAS28959.1 hypothetical protein LIP_3131 [Limnochorda pilosa]